MEAETEIKKEKKKGKGATVAIVLLVILSLVLGGYIAYDKVFSKDKAKTSTKKTESKAEGTITNCNKQALAEENVKETISLDTNNEVVQRLYHRAYDDREGDLKSNIYPDQKELLISNLSEESKFKLVYANLLKSDFKASYSCKEETFNYKNRAYTVQKGLDGFIPIDSIKRVYKEIFGSMKTFVNSTVMYTDKTNCYAYFSVMKPDTNEEGWMLYMAVGGGSGFYKTDRNITKAEQTGDEIKIYETITSTDPDNKKTTENIIYTFKINNDDSYTYYSRTQA